MKICILISKFTKSPGGCQKHLLLLIQQFLNHQHEIILVTRDSGEEYDLPGVCIVKTPSLFSCQRIVSGLLYILFGLLALYRCRKEIDVIHVKQMYSASMLGVLAKILFKLPVITKNTATNELGEVTAIKTLPFYRLRLMLLHKIDFFIALTSQAKQELESIGIKSEKICIIPNGVRIPAESAFILEVRRQYKEKLGINKRFLFVYTGRFAQEKNLDIMLLAISKLKKISAMNVDNLQCLFIGEGGKFRNRENELRALSQELKLNETVKFISPTEKVYDYLLAADIFFLLSTSEGLSNSLIEAMACGNIIVATEIDANKDFLKDNENSLLLPVRNVDKLVTILNNFLSNPDQWYHLGQFAKKKVLETMSISTVAHQHLALYKKAMAKKI